MARKQTSMLPGPVKSDSYDLRINTDGRNWQVRACLQSGDIYCAEMSEPTFTEFCEQNKISFPAMQDAFADSSFHGPMVVDDVQLTQDQLRKFGFVNTH